MINMFSNWFSNFKQRVKGFTSNVNYNVVKSKHDPSQSPEIMREVSKFASIFMDAEVTVQDANENIQQEKTQELNRLLASDPLHAGKSSFLSTLCKVSLLQGGAILKKTIIDNRIATLDLLEPELITATADVQQNRLSISSYSELFKNYKYHDYYTGKVIDLTADDVEIYADNINAYTHRHLNYCTNNLYLVSRLSDIQQKIDNSFYANNMLSSLLNRCSFMFLSRENKSEFTTLSTTEDTKERTKNFNEARHVENSAVVPVGDNMRVLNATISVKTTGVFDAFEDTISCLLYTSPSPRDS